MPKLIRPSSRHAGKTKDQLIRELSLLEDAVDAIPEAFVSFDDQDRLVYFNDAYQKLFPSIAAALEPGMAYRELLRVQLSAISLDEAAGREEAWIEESIARRRSPGEPTEQKFSGGQLIQLSQHKTASDGSIDIRRDVTDLREAEQARRQSEEGWAALFQQSPSAMVLTETASARILAVNDAWCTTWGYSHDEVIGKRTTEMKIWHDVSQSAVFYEELERLGFVESFEATYLTKEGTPRKTQVAARKVVLNGIEQLQSVVVDVTEKRMAEQALAQSEQHFRNLIEGSNQGITIIVGGRIAFANEMAVEIFGYDSRDALIAIESSLELVAPEDRTRVLAYRNSRLTGGSPPITYEFKALQQDGTVVWMENHITTITWHGTTAILIFSVDISERKSAAAAIERFVDALEFAPQGIALWDADQRLIYHNKQYCEFLGPAGENLAPGADLTDLHRQIAALELMDDSIGRQEDWVIDRVRELARPTSDRRFRRRGRWHQRSSQRLPDGGLIIQTNDIDDLVTAEEQLRQSQKMEAVGQLTGGIAHDFNNLLAVILGHLELAADGLPDGSQTKPMLATAISATNRGAELIHQLLAFSAKQTLKPETLDINGHLQPTTDMLRRVLDETIELNMNAAPEQLFCTVDPRHLETALLNLAINARDAMPDGGRLTIDAGRAEIAADDNNIAPGSYVKLTVTDTGAGMPEKVLSRVFEPFFTTKDQGKGTGLGLSMVYGFVKQSAGNIAIHSKPGQGTKVTIHLPRHDGPDVVAPATIEADAVSTVNESILLVEDDGSLLEMASQLLRSLGYTVHEAGDGPAAFELLQSGIPIDLLLTDVVLPKGINGPDIATYAQNMNSNIKVLFMSGYNEHPMLNDGGPDKPFALINKPFRKAQLAREIRDALHK